MTATDTTMATMTSARELRNALALVSASFVLALLVAALIMLATGIPPATIALSFWSLLIGGVGSLQAISETLVAATPLALAGLGIAIGFRAGLFNIGAEGQLLIGGICGLVVGFAFTGLPAIIHISLALLAAFVGGAIWGGISGWLKVATGAHEVITTIMLNLIALRLTDYLLRNPPIQNPERSDPISRSVAESAALPRILGFLDPTLRVDIGIVIAVVATVAVALMMKHLKLGFEFRVLGANLTAATFAGIRSGRTMVIAMLLGGGLAGLAGASQTIGVLGRASPHFSAGLGFEAIAVALLARSSPVGVLFAALLFGALHAGGRKMQVDAAVSIDLITIVQALIVLCIAAPMLIHSILPWIRDKGDQAT